MRDSAWDRDLQVLRDGDIVIYRGWRDREGTSIPVLVLTPGDDPPTPGSVDRLVHEYRLKERLDGRWAARPLELVHQQAPMMLVLADPGGEPLDGLCGRPVEVGRFLRLALAIATALGQMHRQGLVHKDLKPAHILVDEARGAAWLTGFGIALSLPRERQVPAPPEVIAGTLAYMAPEQTGRMNRSTDSRSDLYALGVIFYQMLTGALPFSADDPMGWVHCHIACQPPPPEGRVPGLPAALSAIVMKCLAKIAEERYQTAAGLAADLRRCLAAWELIGWIEPFPLGEKDQPDRLLIPEKLYGRDSETATLLSAFDRVVTAGTPELVLVSGYSGIGKSALINELHKVLVPPRGLFASGKFDQYKRDIPYTTLAQAFQGLIRPLLCQSEAQLCRWRDAFREALEPNGRLMVDLVPELRLIIGDQPPVPELPPQQAQARFQLVFRRFLDVFARSDHPLALFLDDLQWMDAATLEVIEDLLTGGDLQHVLLIGAYRDNEVDATHPLRRMIDAVRSAGAAVAEIRLAPLVEADLRQLVADALRCSPAGAAPLAALVLAKTAGNPFFVIQFLHALVDEGLLGFDPDAAGWSWNTEGIHAKGYTDNVVDLMVGKLHRLPAETRSALQQLSCLGNTAETGMLSIVLGKAEDRVQADLWEAVCQELIVRLGKAYRFIHDRVQEAAYSLIPEASRAAAHLQIGRLLAAQTPAERREEAIFEIVNQLNRGASLITERQEREQLAELNLVAGRRAKAATAYASALTYLGAGAALLPEDAWERRHALSFALELNRAECEFLTGALAEAEQRLAALSGRVSDTINSAAVACLRVDLYTTLDQGGRAIAVGLDYLRLLGIDWSPHPAEEEVHLEYERIWNQLGTRPIEALIDLPLMHDEASLATLDVLTRITPAALLTDFNLFSLVTARAVNLSLERGNCDGSCCAYGWLGWTASVRFRDFKAAFRFGRLGYDLVEQRGQTAFQARPYVTFGNTILPWTEHVRAGRDLIRRAFEMANRGGDLTFAAYSVIHLITNLLAAGDPLADVEHEAEHALAFAQKARFGFAVDSIRPQLGLVRTLRGLTPTFGVLGDEDFERGIEQRFSGNSTLALAECCYWIRRLQARFFAGDHVAAIEAASRVRPLLWTSPAFFEAAEYHFYGALSRAAACDMVVAGESAQHLNALTEHYRQLEVWAANCPENFECRLALVGAELARIDGRHMEAMHLYERAISSAHQNGFVHNEALAGELAGQFYLDHGLDTNGFNHLRQARAGYARWGADGKVRQLDRRYPRLAAPDLSLSAVTIDAHVQQMDVAAVAKASQAVSGEIEWPRLIETLMTIALQYAGADRGLLILPHDGDYRIEAEARANGKEMAVALDHAALTGRDCPEALLRYVIRTRQNVILDDAARPGPFGDDASLHGLSARSVVCLPLLRQACLAGVLYLENSQATHVFTPQRIAVLELLAGQAAISLENTRLYGELKEREAKIRRLVDANIIGIVVWDFDGRIIEANDSFLHMVGYDRADLASGCVRWTDLTPPEWLSRERERWLPELKMTGSVQPCEKDFVRKDGNRVPVLIGAATLDGAQSQGVAFVLDLSESKVAEHALRQAKLEAERANAAKSRFLAAASHDLRQPAQSLMLLIDALAVLVAGQPAAKAVAHMATAAEALKALLDGLLDISRLHAGLVQPCIQAAPLGPMLGRLVEEYRPRAMPKGLDLRLVSTRAWVRTDPILLERILRNLIENAIKYTESGKILLGCRHPEGFLRLEVHDTGIGIPPEQIDRVFEEFHQINNPARDRSKGLGLGLAIVRRLAEILGVTVGLDSSPDRGSCFTVTLPRAAEEPHRPFTEGP